MKITQVASYVNDTIKEIDGTLPLLNEDLSNVVEVGTSLANVGGYDAYAKSLPNHIGKVAFAKLVVERMAPDVMRDSWEYGSILEKIRVDIPLADDNETWELQDGQSYDPNVFTAPKASVKFWNSIVTFEIPISITRKQIKQSFSDATQLASFVAYVFNAIEAGLTVRIDNLTMKLFAGMIADTLYETYQSGTTFTGAGDAKAVNLYALWMVEHPSSTLTASDCINDPEFLRFAVAQMRILPSRMKGLSKLYNIDGVARTTPYSRQKWVMLNDFREKAGTYLYDNNGQVNTEHLILPDAHNVPYWQGTGTDYGFDSISKIYVTSPAGHSVEASGILAVCYDEDALAITNTDRYVDTNHNGKASFDNYWFKYEAGYLVDEGENFVVFFVA